jgi:hypothetical protein
VNGDGTSNLKKEPLADCATSNTFHIPAGAKAISCRVSFKGKKINLISKSFNFNNKELSLHTFIELKGIDG